MKLPKTSEEFLCVYFLKIQLVAFCKKLGLPQNGSKEELTKLICLRIDGKPTPINQIKKQKTAKRELLRLDAIIPDKYSNDEYHREYFLKEIGSHFKYNVQFMDWIKKSKGRHTYQDAINEWKRIEAEKKKGVKFNIGKQFEYNQYSRDFFADNPHRSKAECLKCWNYKKANYGNHKYERKDLKKTSEKLW